MSGKETYEPSPKALEEIPIGAATSTARTSIDTSTDAESLREIARQANPNGFSSTSDGVDIKAAEAEFATLQRELSGISQASRKLSRTQSKGAVTEKDVEKAVSDGSVTEEETFDLEHVLRGNHTVSSFHCLNERCILSEDWGIWDKAYFDTAYSPSEHFADCKLYISY
jgi:ATP-binding cassette subfamily G (WHITE) protein 2 (SNQ2)